MTGVVGGTKDKRRSWAASRSEAGARGRMKMMMRMMREADLMQAELQL